MMPAITSACVRFSGPRDVNGRLVKNVVEDAHRAPGLYQVSFDLSGAPSGVYFCRLAAGAQAELRKIVRMR